MGKVERFTNSTTGGPVFVDVQDGKILRIDPDGPRRHRRPVVDHRGPGAHVYAASAYDGHALHGGPPVHDLLAQAGAHAAQAGGLRPERRAQLREARRIGLRAHQLGRGPRHRGRGDQPDQARRRVPGPSSPPAAPTICGATSATGTARISASSNLVGMVQVGAQPRQLGGLALGRHAHVGLQPSSGHPRAVRPAGGRPQAHGDDRLLVGRSGEHRRRHLLRLREHRRAATGSKSWA